MLPILVSVYVGRPSEHGTAIYRGLEIASAYRIDSVREVRLGLGIVATKDLDMRR